MRNRVTMALIVFLWGLLMGCAAAMLGGCHTISGFGHDLQDWSSEYVDRD